MLLSENVRALQPSATLAMAARARELKAQGRDIIDLSAGEPDFPTPAFIADAGIAAIREGYTKYTPAAGVPALRQAIARELSDRFGRTIDPAGVIVTSGAKQAIFNAAFVLFGPGDEVLIPAPYWTSYPEIVQLARATPVPLRGPEQRDFKISPAELDAAATQSTRGLMLNSPSNPAGTVYTRAELEAIMRWAQERGVWVLSDEIYGRICYDACPAPGILELDDALLGRAILIDGASKTFAMTGWRIGFSYCEPKLALQLAALQSHVTTGATTPAQYAAAAAYAAKGEQLEELRRMVAVFHRRRDMVLGLIRELLPGAGFIEPQGAFYVFFRIDGFFHAGASDSVSLCTRLLEDAGVAVVPGAAFGDDRYARLSFATSEDALREGIRRIASAVAAARGAA